MIRILVTQVLMAISGMVFFSCGEKTEEEPADALFRSIPADRSGIDFSNDLTFDKDFNIYTYRNFYNGGGVALGDVNNDGLVDVYFTANMGDNKLYLNKGNFEFEDITAKAGVAGTKAWSTGVSMADVNGDGWLDIYVCNSGDIKGDNKQNELFINNGDLTFAEKAEEYGIADRGFSTHSVFFDYDKDNDLDLYILNNSYQAIGSFNLRKNERPKRDPLGGDKLMRNENGKFVDVSEQAGIYGSVIGFGLGVTIGDVNSDGWQDIYVSNDFFERDYLYINNHDGTFREDLTAEMKSISGASMGADLADINNDTYPDIFVTEMLPADNARIKTVTTFENWDRYQYAVQNDYYHQFTRNMLQINNGNSTFSEVGRLAGVEATDWSWGALMFDMDNDGKKDIFVANGIYQDLTNQDYLQYVSNEEVVKSIVSGNGVDYKKLVELIPSNPVPNFAFMNEGDLRFTNMAREWGLGKPGFSNGAAYGDLDNDGDLDLVVNNVNSQAWLYENRTNEVKPQNRFLKFELKGLAGNINAFGAKITATDGNERFYLEHMPIRGFESSMDPRPNLGVGNRDTISTVRIDWPDGTVTLLNDVKTNQVLKLEQSQGVREEARPPLAASLFRQATGIIDYKHEESQFVDFDRDRLTFHMISNQGPRTSQADVNGDGLVDVYVGGSRGFGGTLFLQNRNGTFGAGIREPWMADNSSEDAGSEFFDADGDGDMDLYVCSGSNEVSSSSVSLADRLYINNGKGAFTKSQQLLPTPRFESKSTVKAADFDQDGDQDLFVGVRLQPGLYGIPSDGYILRNDGKGNFSEVSAEVAPGLKSIGMITDAAWADVDGDKDNDLVVVGEYMAIRLFRNEGGKLQAQPGFEKTEGWWNRIVPADLDGDGDIDFVAGNFGKNSRFRATSDKPVCMYVNDFDSNGTIEHIVCTYVGEKSYPLPLRHDLIAQIPSLKKKYLKYDNYKDQTIEDIFTQEQLSKAIRLNAYLMASVTLINDGKGNFTIRELPVDAQLSPVYGIVVGQFKGDASPDLLLAGNLYRVKPEIGRYDASYGSLLVNDGKGNWTASRGAGSEREFTIDGEVRDMFRIPIKGKDVLFVTRNNETILTFTGAW